MIAGISAALWVVRTALSPVTDGLLESWAASAGLSPNIDALKMQLLYAQGMLDNAQGIDIRSPALKELLHKLRQLAYQADDVLDELDYFRIQDALDGTYHAADLLAQGKVDSLILHARNTARAAANKLKLSSRSRDAGGGDPDEQDGSKHGCLSVVRSCCRHEISSSPSSPINQGVQEADGGCKPKVVSCARSTAHTIGKHFPCYSLPYVHDDDADSDMLERSNMGGSGRRLLCGAWPSKASNKNNVMPTSKLKFDRVKISEEIMEIVEQLKPLCAMVSTILDKELLGSAILKLDILGSNHTTKQDTGMTRPKTTPKIIQPELYGRDNQIKNIVDSITHGEYCADELTVLPLVGPGGIGKTTLTQHIYSELENSFQVSVWVCVSLDFNVNRLVKEIVKQIPKVNDENQNASDEELIEQRLKSKRLLLVLDDMWTYQEDEWNKLLAPLRYKGGEKGNVVIVTTRIPEVASMVRTTNSSISDVGRLDPKDIMSLFEICVFGYQQPWEDHPELRDVGSKIVINLKGFPLAAKTVGRLLRNKLTLDHWSRVVESREWELQTGPNDIMPALKLSYDFLPFHLQQCFSSCALFPEDYEFSRKELVHLWIGLNILHSTIQNRRIEDVGLDYLDDLVNHGFCKENKKEDGHYYVIHDLLHELAVKVSSHECLSIHSSNARFIPIPPSIRHLSIIVDDSDVKDITTFEKYKSDLSALGRRLTVQNLRTLMLFGEYHGSFAVSFGDLLREARALRVVFLSGASYSTEDMLLNFSDLVHLRYLRIKSVFNRDLCLPSALFRFYHLEILDLEKWAGRFGSTTQMSNLIKLRHFLVPQNNLELHSSIHGVGKLKFLGELRRFEVGKEVKGYELSQLGELTELGGSLGIFNIEKVLAKEEGKELKLIHKNHLHKLTLEWDIDRPNKDPLQEENVLESLVPHKNLQHLCIRGHGGAKCPSWLCGNLTITNLESLCLYDISWNKLPPLGDMWFIDDLGVGCQGLVPALSFQCLKRLELVKIPRLTKWVGNDTCHLFSHLEVVNVEYCPELMELPFSPPTCHQTNQEENMSWFPNLRVLKIVNCPKLSSLPPIPWTPAPCSAEINGIACGFRKLSYSRNNKQELSLRIKGKGGQNGMLWSGLDFTNLTDLVELVMENCPPLPMIHLQKLKYLNTLKIRSMSTVLLLFEGESHSIGCPLPVKRIEIQQCDANGEELTQLLSHFPKLTALSIESCGKITELGVVEHQKAVAISESLPSSSHSKFEHAPAGHLQQQTKEDEVASATEGLLLLPPQLQDLDIYFCRELRLLSNSLGNGNARDGLQSLCSLRSFAIIDCPQFLSSYSTTASSCFPFPTSLQNLYLEDVEGMETLDSLSNLVSLDDLAVSSCRDLRGDGLWPLVSQGCLTGLRISETPKFFTGSELWLPREEERRSYSSKLKSLETDDLAGVLNLPICSLLFSSFTKLTFSWDREVERFTEGQEEAIHRLTSLQELMFWDCEKLQRLPGGLTKLTNLKRLEIWRCPAIQLLPKDGLPSSLQELKISDCPAIKSLPKDTLPGSLRKLEVHGISEELKRQCHKLSGTIPIIIDYKEFDFWEY